MEVVTNTCIYNGQKMQLADADLWFISEIRKLNYGTLSSVEISNGQVALVKKTEKKVNPGSTL